LLLAGHLTDGLHSSDFGSGFGSAADDLADVIPISRKAASSPRSQSEDRLAGALEQAERAVRGAERRRVEAQERRDRLVKPD
jgi:hypothetical protein